MFSDTLGCGEIEQIWRENNLFILLIKVFGYGIHSIILGDIDKN